MSNNNAIQILRTNGITDDNKNIALLDGQPFYNKQKNYLTIGNGTKTANGLPITVPTVEGWFDDIDQPSSTTGQTEKYLANIGGNTTNTNKYYIKPAKHYFNKDSIVGMLEVHAPGILLDGAVKINGQLDFGENNPDIDYNVRVTSYIDGGTSILKVNSNKRTVNDGGEETITPGKVDIFGGSGIRLSSTSIGSSTPDSLTGSTINIQGSSEGTDTRSITLDTASLTTTAASTTIKASDDESIVLSNVDNKIDIKAANIGLTGTTTITGATSITNETESGGTTSGALKVSGGVGVAKNLYVGGRITTTGGNGILSDGNITVTSGQINAPKFTSDINSPFYMKIEKSNELNFSVNPSADNKKIFFNYRKLDDSDTPVSVIRFGDGTATSTAASTGLGSIECAQVTCNDKVTLQYDTSSNALKFVFI